MAPRHLPPFFKILLDRSAPHLALPAGFVRKHLENNIPENPTLLSVDGGYSWRLKIKKDGESHFFADGWNDVVEDSGLGFGDFLIFWLVDESTFKLSIFSPNGCEKDFPVESDDVNDEEEEDDDDDDEKEGVEVDEEKEEEDDDDNYDDGGDEVLYDGDEDDDCGVDIYGDDGDPFFMKIISKYPKFALRVPLGFARLAGIESGRTVIMKNLAGKEWPMKLLKESKHYNRYCLSAGWSKFRKVNKLSKGDKCVFKYIRKEDKLCLAKVNRKRISAIQPPVKVPATEIKKTVESTENGEEAVKKKIEAKQPAGKAPVAEFLERRLRRQPARKDNGRVVVEEKVTAKPPAGKATMVEVLKRSRGRPPRVEVVEKKVGSEKPVGNTPVAEVLKRKRGRRSRVKVEVERKDGGVKVVKRPCGRPFKRNRGRPTANVK